MKKRKMKKCSKCKLEKDFSQFYLNKKNNKFRPWCKTCWLSKNKEYVNSNKNKILDYQKEYHKINRSKLRVKQTAYVRNRLNTDIKFKLAHGLRDRLRKAIKGNQKSGSAISDLGCSIEKFKLWIEMNWQNDMSWDNYGVKGWHIDHKIPLDSFDLTNKEEFIKACHFSNLQPMWAKDNFSKGNKICQ